jgi:hypothetical protein
MKFDDHDKVIEYRKTAQNVECDSRDRFREAIHFITKKDGQWEPDIIDRFDNYDRPRYTFDLTKPKLLKAWGEIADQEIQINVKPAGGDANKDTAKTIAGLLRNIEYQSGARDIYSTVTRRFMTCGFDAGMVEQDWADNDSFSQELFIRPITDAVDRVWFLGNWTDPTGCDAPAVTLDHMLDEEEFAEMFDVGRKCNSLDTDSFNNYYYHKRKGSIVSQLFYKEAVTKTLIEGPNGEVIDAEDQESIDAIVAKYPDYDIGSARTRERQSFKVMTRYYDAEGWLNDPEEIVFDLLPIVLALPNFEIVENKPISMGMVEPLMDQQRVHNYAISKYVGDAALAPKPKIWATAEHLDGYESKLKSYNDNKDPVFVYNAVPDAPPPFQMGATGADQSLLGLVDMTRVALDESSGLFGPSMGKQMGQQSGYAIEQLQHKGDVGSLEYHNTIVRFAQQIAKICVRAIPKVYDTPMIKRVIGEDGDSEDVEINQTIMGPNGPMVLNDLTKGVYDVYCDIGPAYRSRRTETTDKLVSLGQIDPSIVAQNKDIIIGSIDLPGMELAAGRARAELLKAGAIPPDQWTDEEEREAEEAAAAAAANPPPPDPMALVAQAEVEKAQAQTQKVEVEAQTALIKAQQAQQKMDFEQEKQKIELLRAGQDQILGQQAEVVNMLKTMSEILKNIGESSEKDVSLSPSAQQAYDEQAGKIGALQDGV